MKRLILIFSIFCLFQSAMAQNRNDGDIEMVRHTVELGETVRMISKKYLVNPSDIYKYNKFAVDGVREGMVLILPVPRKEPEIIEEQIAENQSEDQIQTAQESASTVAEMPLKKDQTQENRVSVIDRDATVEHIVQPGETLYNISKQYNVSADEIKLSNPQLKKGLQAGQVIQIPSVKTIDSSESSIGSSVTPKAEVSPKVSNTEGKSGESNIIKHQVAPKETMYSLSKQYNISVEDLKAQNPTVEKHGLQVGQIITITTN